MPPNRNTHYAVRNINGTSANKCWCGNWLKHWRMATLSRRLYCSVLGCWNLAEVGAHVTIDDMRYYQTWYIVPMCKAHNHYRNYDPMFLKLEIELIPANVAATCQRTDWWT